MKLLILGMSRHGKDTAAKILERLTGMRWISSSEAACERVVYPMLADKYRYNTPAECHADRHNHRIEWRELITAYNTPDKSRLCREILAESDCYVGMRCNEEYRASRALFDVVLWIDASERLPADPSMDIPYSPTMLRVDNNGQESEMRRQLADIAALLQDMQP